MKFDEIIIGAGSDGCAVAKHIGDSLSSPAGNCKLRIDPMAAADHKLRFNGVYGLPISGALIMPVVVSGNRNTPATMIGETASALVLGAAQ